MEVEAVGREEEESCCQKHGEGTKGRAHAGQESRSVRRWCGEGKSRGPSAVLSGLGSCVHLLYVSLPSYKLVSCLKYVFRLDVSEITVVVSDKINWKGSLSAKSPC